MIYPWIPVIPWYRYTVCHGVPNTDTIPVPMVPVTRSPQVFPYLCRTLWEVDPGNGQGTWGSGRRTRSQWESMMKPLIRWGSWELKRCSMEWGLRGQASCWRMTGDLASLLYDTSTIAFENPFVRKVTQSEPLGCAIVLRRSSVWLHHSAMQLNCDRYRFRRSTYSFDWDSQYFSREEMISMPQLCAYIFAILFEFSGIF